MVNKRCSKITNDGLTRSDTGCFIAVPITHMATVGVKELNYAPTFSTVRLSLNITYLLLSVCNSSEYFPSDDKFLYQADTTSVSLVLVHLTVASSCGRVSLALTGDTDARTHTDRQTDIKTRQRTTLTDFWLRAKVPCVCRLIRGS